MEQVQSFIESFLTYESESNKMRYNENISDEECKVYDSVIHDYIHTIFNDIGIGRSEGEFDKYRFKTLIKVNLENVQKRPFYQIRKYENPKCGDVIKRVLSEEIIYLCYTGSDKTVKKGKSKYHRIFIVAETDEGLKIISYFRWVDGEYEQLDRYEPTHIKDLGKLVGVEKYLAPEEATSLADYNKD
ncbi:hypothetical protein [Spirochaeta cellobiosiphila]|uniref:hypothetical protein n=1 Tax=Spirochaeta cellobiosiphila TaxID=504483 RepID=UPI0004208E08|nr:hypothetical protein [Spirochaeta cellobiosiphila]